MIGDLPLEIQVKLLHLTPSSALKHVNAHFYGLYNDLYYNKIVQTYGEDIIDVIIKVLPWLKTYIKSLDAFRYHARSILAKRLPPELGSSPLDCAYIRDSWRYIYSVLKNKRLFAEYNDYKIDEPSNYVFNHFVEINRTYLLSYAKSIWLSPGNYNLNIGLVVKHGSGLGTTKFEIKYEAFDGTTVIQTFYPPTNINDILPKQQFCFLRLGEFTIPPAKSLGFNSNHHNKLYKVQLVMEEIGLYLKSGFRIFFIDISQPSLLFNDFDLLYYSVKETDYKYFINLPLKNLYKALNYVQNGGVHDQLSQHEDQRRYGLGDPYEIMEEYDQNYLTVPGITAEDDNSHSRRPSNETNDDTYEIDEETLMKYANFYYNNHYKKRFFKFNTIYQRRQFINRFGDFELDWHEVEELDNASKKSTRSCTYDEEGLKWKIPLIGEL